MDLTRLSPPAHITINISATNREDAIRQTMQPLIDLEIISDADSYNERVLKREAQITTVIGNGVAVPHARTVHSSRLGLAIGILENPIQFSDDPEDEPVQVLFLIAIPSFAPVSHMSLLKHLASFVRYPKKVAKLISSKTPAAASKYLCSYKARAKK